MTPHEAAQSVAWFAFVVVIGIGLVMWTTLKRRSVKAKQVRMKVGDGDQEIGRAHV